MKTLYAFFIFSCLTFFTILTLQYLQTDLPNWIQFYVNDFLCMPVVLTICLTVVHYIKKDFSIRLSLFTVLSLTIIYSDRKSTRLNSSHVKISYAVFCLKKKNTYH